MHVQLVLLACSTALNILADKLCEAQPLELSSNKLADLEVTGVSSSLMVVAAGEDRAMEGILWGNIDVALVCKDVIVKSPVRKVRPEGDGDVLQGRL